MPDGDGGPTQNSNRRGPARWSLGGASASGVVFFNGGTLSSDISVEQGLTAFVSGGAPDTVTLQKSGNLTIRAFDFGSGYSGGDVLNLADLGPDPTGFSTQRSGLTFNLIYRDGSAGSFDIRALNSLTFIPADEWTGTITITLTAVPEPATASLLWGGIVMAAIVGRRQPRTLALVKD